jgi:hypothetical protein
MTYSNIYVCIYEVALNSAYVINSWPLQEPKLLLITAEQRGGSGIYICIHTYIHTYIL